MTPRPPLPIGKSPVWIGGDDENRVPGQSIRQCFENVHVFEGFGECQCGSEFWQSPVPDALPEEAEHGE